MKLDFQISQDKYGAPFIDATENSEWVRQIEPLNPEYDLEVRQYFEKIGEVDVIRAHERVTISFVSEIFFDLDWQSLFDTLNDYYQAVRFTPTERLNDGISRALGLEFLKLLYAVHDYMWDHIHEIEDPDREAEPLEPAFCVVPERLGFKPLSLAEGLYHTFFPVSWETQNIPESMWKLISDEYGYFKAKEEGEGTYFDELAKPVQDRFWTSVEELGLHLAMRIKDGIEGREKGRMYADAPTPYKLIPCQISYYVEVFGETKTVTIQGKLRMDTKEEAMSYLYAKKYPDLERDENLKPVKELLRQGDSEKDYYGCLSVEAIEE